MRRYEQSEILDGEGVDDHLVARAYRELHNVHRFLGTTSAVLRLLRRQPSGTNPRSKTRVLDIGCGQGAMLAFLCSRTGFDGIGFDLRPAPPSPHGIPVYAGNAVYDPLPQADVAICVMMAHHLTPDELGKMIDNVSRSCRRFVIIDLVRHPVPLMLFRIFLCPFLSRLNALDGQTSICRAFTASEMKRVVQDAEQRGLVPVRSIEHSVAPFWIRQVIDIQWEEVKREERSTADEQDAEEELTSASRI